MKRETKRKAGPWAPRVLHDHVLAGAFALVVFLFAGAGIMDRYLAEGGSPYFAAVIVATLVDLANDDREAQQLARFSVNPKLVAAAQAKADDMAAKGYFSHTTPEGYDSWHWFKEAGYEYAYAGENLAVDFSESSDVQRAWMGSPTHRDNILNDQYTEIGIAVAHGTYNGHPATFAVQMFGRPNTAEIAARAKENTRGAARPLAAAPETIASEGVGATLGAATEAAMLSADSLPWWAGFLAQPKLALRIAYYVIGLVILVGLFVDFEYELKWHHFRHAKKVGYLLATMSMLFIAADWAFFADPAIAALIALI